MSWSSQGNGWAGSPAAQDELAMHLGQLALRADAGSDPTHLMSTRMHSPALASDHLLSQARQSQFYQGARVQGMPVQTGVNMKPAGLLLGVRGVPTSVPAVNGGLMHAAHLGAGRVHYSTARASLCPRSAAQGMALPAPQLHNQAALLALMQNQLAAAQKQQQGYAGTIPAVPSMVQQAALYSQNHVAATANQEANMAAAAAAAATAATQVAGMRNAATLGARSSIGMGHVKRQTLGADLPNMGQQHWGANGLPLGSAELPGSLQHGLQGSWGPQPSLAGTNGAQLQQLAQSVGQGHGTGHTLSNGVGQLGQGNLGHLGLRGHGTASRTCDTAGGGQQTAGLYAPSIMATAPMLPILGEDLAKPNVHCNQGVLQGHAPSGIGLMQSALSALQSAASLNSSSVKSHGTGMTQGSILGGSPKLASASDSPAQELIAADGGASSAPLAALKEPSLAQAQTNALGQTEGFRLMAAQCCLLGQSAAGPSPGAAGPVAGMPASSTAPSGIGGGAHRERDMSTLKTLGQMLARTGNTVETAVQTGLLGGCNAEDVKVIWEAYTVELAGMQHASSLRSVWSMELPKGRHLGTSVLSASNLAVLPTASASVGGVIGDKRGAPEQEENLSPMLQPSAAAGSTAADTPAMSSVSGSLVCQKAMEEEEEGPNWDEIFENEKELVPVHGNAADLATAGLKIPSDGAFNALSYAFFGGAGDSPGELLEEEGLEVAQKPGGNDWDIGDDRKNPALWQTMVQGERELDSKLVEDSLTEGAEKEGKHDFTVLCCDDTRLEKGQDDADSN